ncbi:MULTISPECIES: UDP-N-acetyl-D-mannosamine dehydrogenase [Desulfovibrio]|uniref:UDP-N-acetyl-D-mannosaminuronic acid dehydrogenase n=1 Tax=Desulfovibrio desulfuricans TaxID=876 RepID=A0AA94HUB4_DESDE|nr:MULTISPECIES: UDP-N-acetyl-D-mannosamine dehydrogenase [Desulfovibrio]ATD80934.1 UDP-N-acetyl-D-mannosamine dehydrogenase [Desulfovibrio sp. G11]SFW64368.1 UDP-N-acetyl-D-mannosaminuronic acid dehydrogenase [Desulfovibrio desulfuricans]SPD36499.1 UDP-N-acetyl-D-mannosamine dehydrogenase [Desulfovibrio sp. G11]
MSYTSISVIGLGYIGLPTAALIASHVQNVIGVDVSEEVVNSVNTGTVHSVEPGLTELLAEVTAKGWLRAVTVPEPADVFIIAVPTPITDEKKPDLSYVRAAALSLAPALRKGALVILESTSPVGTTEQVSNWLAEARPDLTFPHQSGEDADVQIAYCPERIMPGKMLGELVNNDRIVGGLTEKATAMAVDLYKIFVLGQIVTTTTRTAEMCKLVENSFRDVNIAFANELSMICDNLDIDVWELIELANRHPRVNILQPGCGVGGHCIPVDPWFIVASAPTEACLIKNAREINDYKPRWVATKIKKRVASFFERNPKRRLEDLRIACLGVSYKANLDDIRNSPAIEIIEAISELGSKILVVDPNIKTLPGKMKSNIKLEKIENIKNADIVCVLISHDMFILEKDIFSNGDHVVNVTSVI